MSPLITIALNILILSVINHLFMTIVLRQHAAVTELRYSVRHYDSYNGDNTLHIGNV